MTAIAELTDFVTVTDVEIAHVGMDWPASTGPVTLTLKHLQDAVTAATQDPHFLQPRLKIGHVDPRFNEDPPVVDPFAYHGPLREDGNPVYGKVTNLRIAEDGMVLLGDYTEVPSWLGDALPSAYPSRSLEGDFDVQTEGGKRYSFVITAVALLGEPLPAITCLDDLVRELTGGPAAVRAQTPITLTGRNPMPVAATASIDAVREQFFNEFAQGDRYWWWPIDILVDDAYVLADDDEGHLYRVPITTDADGNVSWGDPARGVLDFRAVPDSEPVAAARKPMFASAAQAGRPKDRVRAATPTTKEDTIVDISTLRESLDLPDATDDEVIAAAAEKLATAPAANGEDGELEPAAEIKEPIAASAVTLDPETYEGLKNDAKMGREAREAQLKTERESFVDKAVSAGKIVPSRRDHYLSLMSVDETGTREFIEKLAPGAIPVGERSLNPDRDGDEPAVMDRIMAGFGVTPAAGRGN